MRYLVIFLLTVSNLAFSATKTFVSGSWSAGVWSPTGAPTATDDVIINSGTCTVPISYSATCASITINGGALTVLSATPISVGGNFSMIGGTMTLGSGAATLVPFPSVSGTISLTGGTVSYAAANDAQVINTAPTYYALNINRNLKSISSTLNVASNLTFTTTSTLTTSANINVAGNITGSGTLVLDAGVTLDVKGSVSNTTLTCDATSIVNYSGSAAQTGKATIYGDLVKNGSSTLTIASGFSAQNIQLLAGILSTANCTILNAGDIEVADGATLRISGSFPAGYGSVTFGSLSTINYTGVGNIEPLTYENLSLTSAARTAIGNTTVNGNLALSASFLTLAPTPIIFEVVGDITGTATSTIESNDGYLSIGGLFTAAVLFNTSTSSTVDYSGNLAAQAVAPEQYNNLIFSGSADKTLSGTIQIDGTFSNTASGAVSTGTSTVEFNSSNDGQIIPEFSFYRLTVSNAPKVLSGNVVVTRIGAGAISLNGTTITTGSFNIRILRNSADAITLSDPSTDYIIGNLSRNFANGTTILPFPLGTTAGSLPLQVQITGMTAGSGTTTANGFLTVSSTFITDTSTYTGFAGANFTSFDNTCNRYWTIANSGFTFTSLRAGLKFFNPDDLGSAVTDPLNFLCRVQKTGVWTDGTLPNIDSDTATVSGLTLTAGNSMNIWLGEKNTTYCISKITPANWNSAATWSCGKIPTSSDTAVIKLGHVITLDNTANTARYLQIDGTAALSSTATIGNIGSRGILISPTGVLTRTAGTPTLLTTGNLVINNATAIPTTLVLAMAGTGDSIKTSQTNLAIPRLTINSSVIYNTVPHLTISTDLNASATANVLTQASGTILTLSDQSTNITLDASATNAEVIYDRGTAQTINRGTYYKLTLTSTTAAAKVTTFPTGTTSTIVTNELKVEVGSAVSHSLNKTLTTTTLTGTGATFIMSANTSLNLGVNTTTAAVVFPSTFGTYSFDPTSVVNYNTNGAQTISGIPTYQNLNITTGASNVTKTLGENTTVTSALTITNDVGTATLSLGTNTLNIAGTISGTGTLLCPINSTVNYNSGSTSQTVLSQQFANLTFSNSATKNLPTAGVLVSGNLTSNSSLSIPTNSTLTLNGTSGNQVVNTPLSFYNLYKTGAATVSFSTSNTSVTNLFSVKDGSGLISPNSLLTIVNGASLFDSSSTTSSFATGSSGFVNVLKTATGTNRSFYLSGPVSGYTSTDLNAGQTASVLRFDSDAIPSDVATVYKNTCATALRQNGSFQGLYKNTTGALSVGKGYSVLQATNKNITFNGNPNFGTVTFSPITSVNRTTPDGAGYAWCATTNGLTLLGNPYPTPIDWKLVYTGATGINPIAKIWNGTNYTDVSESASLANRLIKAGQGFIVQATAVPANSLSFTNAQRMIGTNGALLRTEDNALKIELKDAQNNELNDILTINFNEDASDHYDITYDSYDLPGIPEVPSIVAIVDGNGLSTTQFPEPSSTTKLPVSLDVNGESGYEVKLLNIAAIPSDMEVYLVDKTNNTEYDLSKATSLNLEKGTYLNYEIQLRKGEASTSENSNSVSQFSKVYASNNKIVIENSNDNLSDITIYDITGKLVATKTSVSKGKYEIEVNNKNQTQMYIVKLSSNTTTDTYKVILY